MELLINILPQDIVKYVISKYYKYYTKSQNLDISSLNIFGYETIAYDNINKLIYFCENISFDDTYLHDEYHIYNFKTNEWTNTNCMLSTIYETHLNITYRMEQIVNNVILLIFSNTYNKFSAVLLDNNIGKRKETSILDNNVIIEKIGIRSAIIDNMYIYVISQKEIIMYTLSGHYYKTFRISDEIELAHKNVFVSNNYFVIVYYYKKFIDVYSLTTFKKICRHSLKKKSVTLIKTHNDFIYMYYRDLNKIEIHDIITFEHIHTISISDDIYTIEISNNVLFGISDTFKKIYMYFF